MPISEHVSNLLSPKIDQTIRSERRRLAGPGAKKDTMKALVAALLVAGSCLALASDALAASPAYCALYAREYANGRIGTPTTGDAVNALQRIQDQAYYRCLNMDDEPDFPASSAYFGAGVEEIVGEIGAPFEPIGEGDVSLEDDPLADGEADSATETAQAAPASKIRTGSEKQPWTPEWKAWCAEHYRSFNPDTGTVLTFSGEKKLCP